MELNQNSVFEIDQKATEEEVDFELDSAFVIDSNNKSNITPKKILGYYLSIVENFFKEKNKNINIQPFFQEEFIPDNANPVILINRGMVSPAILSVPGGTYQLAPGVEVTGIEGINSNETKAGAFLLSQQMAARIYSSNRAELEMISYEMYKLLLGLSDDVLNEIFYDVIMVRPPSMSSVQPVPKSSDYYMIEMEWEIVFKECNILIFKEKLLKYNRLIVHDNAAKEIL
jgi:hypothetical protein